MGAGVARALGRGRGVLLKNHGVVVTGASIEEAVIGTLMLENGAMVQMIAEAAGELAPEFPRADIEKLKHDITPARSIQGQFRLPGAAGEAPRVIVIRHPEVAAQRPSKGDGQGASAVSFEARCARTSG